MDRMWYFINLISLLWVFQAWPVVDGVEAPPAVCPARLLTLEECWKIAIEQNPLAIAAEEGVVAAHENVGVVEAAKYPDLNFVSSYTRFRLHFYLPKVLNFIPQSLKSKLTVLGPQNDWNVFFRSRYTIYDGGFTKAQVRGSRALAQAVAEDAEQVRQQIMLDVALAFYGLMADKKIYEVAQKNLLRMEKHVVLANERKTTGDAPMVDVLQVKVATGDAAQLLVKSDSTIKMAMGDLNMAMGFPVESAIDIVAGPEEIFVDPKEIDIQVAFNTAVCRRPEILASEERLTLAYSRVQEAQSAFMPQMYAEGQYGWRNSHFLPHNPNWAVGVTLEMPLFQGFGDMHQLRENQAEYAREQAKHDNLVQKIRQDVWNAYYQLQEAFEGMRQASLQITDAQENLRMAEERYRVGAGTIKDLLDAQVGLAQTEANLVQAQWNYRSNYELFLWTQGAL